MNKKAGERLLSVYWFVILIIIAISIVSGVLHVVGSNMDVRFAEAGLLKEKIVECLVFQGELKSAAFDSLETQNDDSLLKTCKIDLEDRTEKYKGTQQYAISLEFDGERKIFGNQPLLERCVLEGKNMPVCLETAVYILDKGVGKFLKIKTAVDKNEKNVG